MLLGALGVMIAFTGCSVGSLAKQEKGGKDAKEVPMEIATLAGGCFWCMEAAFEKVKGVHKVVSGYTGGKEVNPTYAQVSSGKTGHREAVQIFFDPAVISYSEILDHYWRQIDPTDAGGQFADRGKQYKTAIFYHNRKQKEIAKASIKRLHESGKFSVPIVVPILPFDTFYLAEDYHQDYSQKHPFRYASYKMLSGRASYLDRVWGSESPKKKQLQKTQKKVPADSKLSASLLKQRLSPLQYRVTQQNGTEPPFQNAYWNNKAEGIYVDIVSGEPLFSSLDKFDSRTGWPSFTRPLDSNNIVYQEDFSLGQKRVEVRSRHGNSHLGHLFSDGPPPTGKRYCINSAALRFIPKEKLREAGYGKYRQLFKEEKGDTRAK